MNQPVDIRPADLSIVHQILRDALPHDVRVWVFGSRAKWTTRDSSDLDLAVDAGRALARDEEIALSDAFEESDLPYKVDVVDMHNVSDGFKAVIERDKVLLPKAGEWRTEKLSELVDRRRGISYGVVQPGYPVLGGIPMVRVNNIKNGHIIKDEILKISADIEAKHSRTRLKGGEVLMTIVGTVGDTAITTKHEAGWNVARAVAVIPPREDLSAKWIQLCLQSPSVREVIFNRVTTTVQATLNLRDISELDIPMPPDDERKAISAILGALDDKIELNRRMNATLEEMARALFKSWFVDFDPVHAKMEGKQPFGMDAAIAALFPSRLAPSPLGDIPEGWSASCIGREITTVLGGTPSREIDSFWGGHIPWINSGKANEFRITEASEYITAEGLNNSSTKIMPSRTTVVAITGATLGQVSLVEIETCGNQSLVGVLGNDRFPSEFVYFWIKENIRNLLASQTGGAQQHINKNNVNDLGLIVPAHAVMSEYENISKEIFDIIKGNCIENRSLANMRDYLLPKLISGDIRIGDVEKFVGKIC